MRAFVEHVAMVVRNMNWHIDFFISTCGMQIIRRKETDGQLQQVWLNGGIQLIAAKENEIVQNFHHIGLVVEDFAAVRQAMLAYTEVEQIAGKPDKWLQLPDGIVLELFQEKVGAVEKVLAIELK